MAKTIANLNVRLGFLFDEKTLKGIENSMRRTGQRLANLGSELSLSISAPLAALGGASISAAGDIESLTLALKSQLGTAEAASKELAALTEAAKNPGLGLEQAVRGSVRLQGVGLSADAARAALVQVGNAIASTGGTAQELDAVTRQFAQMISKGRVLQEDVAILSENMPAISRLMQEAFGTTSVEAIRAMGVSGKDFVLQITKAAEALPRVEGGIKNGIGNAMDSLKQSAAKVGLAINGAFNVTGLIEGVADATLFLADSFSALDPTIQKVILSLAGAAIAAGPLLKVYGAMKLASAQLISVWGNVVSGVRSATAAFTALSTAMKLTVVGAALAVVTALAVAYDHYSNSLSDAEKAQQSIANVEKKAAESIAAQKTEVEAIVSAYKSEGTTLEQKRSLLAQLNQINPQYFGQIRVGKGDVEALTAATNAYNAELLRQAKITAAKDRLVEIEKELLNVKEAAEPGFWQSLGNSILSAGNVFAFTSRQAATLGENVGEIRTTLKAEQDELLKVLSATALVDAANRKATTSTKAFSGAMGHSSDQAKEYKKQLEEAFSKETVSLSVISPKPVQTGPLVSSEAPQVPSADALAKPFELAQTPAQQLADVMERLNAGMLEFGAAYAQVTQTIAENGTVAQQAILAMGDAIAQSALSGEASFAKLGQAALGAAAKIIRAYIQQGIAATVAKALGSLPFPINLAAGAAAGGLAAALFTRALSKIGVQGFAKGTKDAPGGLALVGERGPELVNLPRHSQVFTASQTNGMLQNIGGGTVIVGGAIRFDGRDLYLALEKQGDSINRSFGPRKKLGRFGI